MKTKTLMTIILALAWLQITWADPIHDAVNKNDFVKVKELIENDKNLISARNNKQETALNIAASKGYLEIVKYLIEKGADVNVRDTWSNTPLLKSAMKGHYEVVEYLIEKGATVNAYCGGGYTPLHAAVDANNLKITKYLIEHGANINAVNDDAATPLMTACWNNVDKDVFECLVNNGADINLKTNQNQNCINNLVWNGKPEVVKFLVEKGADVNLVATGDGTNALMNAITQNNESFITCILPKVKNINLQDKNNKRTALHWATIKGNYKIVEMLLNAGANPIIRDSNDKTSAEYAIKYGFKDIADLYISKGVLSKDALKNIGTSPLLGKIKSKEAVVMYTGHSGWTVKTKKHLLIFDYWANGSKPCNAGTLNGYILPEDLKNQNTYVLVSHDHGDHFDTASIFSWNNNGNKIIYIYGFDASKSSLYKKVSYNGPAYTYVPSKSQQQVDDIKITTLESNDSGEGFLVEVDGLSIFHAGDHANLNSGIQEAYQKEIDYIAEKAKNIDIAFVPVSGCPVGWKPDAVMNGFFYVVDKLNPKVIFPMHGADREYAYKNFKAKAQEKGYKNKVECADIKGDVFMYAAKN